MIEFLQKISALKTIKRTGWINNGVPEPESIADHMHRMGIISLLIEDSSIDRSKLIKMAIVHDLAEAVVGDFTPFDPISKKEKHQLEFNAIKSFVEELNGNSHANELMELWLEYEQGSTSTALLCKDIDKFEMILQAYEYEKSNLKLIAGDSNLNLESFFESTKGKFSHPEMKSLAEKLYNLRKDV